jgi:UDP-N-acetylmuramate dehydrogenase
MKTAGFEIKENHPLRSLTTFYAGGDARYYAAVSSEEDIVNALDFAKNRDIPVFVLGGGSNLLVSDQGFPGLVIHNVMRGFESNQDGGHMVVSVSGGESWQELVDRCVAAGWQGFECMAGIPGTVGAAPVQNIGAYGQEVSETVIGVETVDIETGEVVVFGNEECGFGYRKSIFNAGEAGRYIVTGVDFRLTVNGSPRVRYRELAEKIGTDKDLTLSKVRDTVLNIRGEKGLLTGDGRESVRSAGSFFRNPIVTKGEFGRLEERVMAAGGCREWAWPFEQGKIKISAACLIQCAGFIRGYRRGNVGISPRHTLIIINYGGASADEIAAFAADVQKKVVDEFGVLMMPEVKFIGFQDNILRTSL